MKDSDKPGGKYPALEVSVDIYRLPPRVPINGEGVVDFWHRAAGNRATVSLN